MELMLQFAFVNTTGWFRVGFSVGDTVVFKQTIFNV